MTARIIHGDMLLELPKMEAETFHAGITDPPYHLTAGKKGGSGPASVNLNTPHGRARIGTGFMGMKWDGGDIAMRPETWAHVLRVLKPGAYLTAFGETRTFHRIACAIEDSGFRLIDTLMWVYGTGFPKSKNQDGDWKGFGSALKPAWEPIILAQKPFKGTIEQNLKRHGCGALNIDGCLVGKRWPANLVHDGSDEVVQLFPSEAGAAAPVRRRNADKFRNTFGSFKGNIDENGSTFHDDSGSAARFFYCPKARRSEREAGMSGFEASSGVAYDQAKNNGSGGLRNGTGAPTETYNTHPTVKPVDVMRWLCRLVTPPGGGIVDAFAGSGSTGIAAVLEGFNFVGVEGEQHHVAIANARVRHAAGPLLFAAEESRDLE